MMIPRLAAYLSDAPRCPSQAVRQAVADAVVDTLSVALAGFAAAPVAALCRSGPGFGSGHSRLWDGSDRTAAAAAALINGTAAHALDFDDNFDPAKVHASAVLLPALIALADERDLDEAAVTDAYACGLQTLAAVGHVMNPAHRDSGWHGTATLGALGSAAACARLLRLDARATGHALSIATSLMGGFMSQFGTGMKPVHAGLAAMRGVLAAGWAEAGLDAAPDALDGAYSPMALMRGSDDAALAPLPDPATLPVAVLNPGLKVKRYANCASAHRSLDALETLMKSHRFRADAISAIEVTLPASHRRNLMHDQPATAEQARFSLPYALALRLVRGMPTLTQFHQDGFNLDGLHEIMAQISIIGVEQPESRQPTQVRVRLHSGAAFQETVWWPVGSHARPLEPAARLAKARACLARAGTPAPEALISHWQHFGGSRRSRGLTASAEAAA
ncbi:MAG: MmgE/PrpD family protein [Rhodothalassiaceae bacterium]